MKTLCFGACLVFGLIATVGEGPLFPWINLAGLISLWGAVLIGRRIST